VDETTAGAGVSGAVTMDGGGACGGASWETGVAGGAAAGASIIGVERSLAGIVLIPPSTR
jgi:hypothetical protein